MVGALGGCGSRAELVLELSRSNTRVWSTGDFVCVPMANFVTVGGTQLRLLLRSDPLDFIGRASSVGSPKAAWLGLVWNDENYQHAI